MYVPIQGRIVDPAGQPLAKARVRVRRIFFGTDVAFPWGPETASGEDGRFTVKHVRRGDEVVVRVDRADLGGTETEPLAVSQSDPITLADLVLRVADQQVTGIVTDQDGEPVAGATVEYLGEPRRVTQTDTAGRFVLDRLPEGRLTLLAKAKDGSRTTPSVRAGSKDLKLFLPLQSLYDRAENRLTVNLRRPTASRLRKPSFLSSTSIGSVGRFPLAASVAPRVVARPFAAPSLAGRRTGGRSLGSRLCRAGAAAVVTRPQIEPVTINLDPAPVGEALGPHR